MACLCAGVTFAELDEAIAADPQPTVASLGAALGCGLQCGSCVPVLKESLGEVAWYPASASVKPITRASDERGLERLIYRVDITLRDDRPYPVVQPGQHIVLRGATDEGFVERTYTVVGQDLQARRLTVAIRRKPGGAFTPWLLRDDGDVRFIEVSVPGGPGLGTGAYRSVVFFAGGVGVTPAVAMVTALGSSATMHLDYSVADADDVAFLSRFDNRRKDRPGFTFHIRDTSLDGPIREKHVRDLVQRHPAAKFYICGPEGYVNAVRRALRKAKVDGGRIHVELFALSTEKRPARTFRFKAYVAGALMAVLPLFVLLPGLAEIRPHGHPNVGHEKLQCVACHVETSASTRQTLQAKVKHVVGMRETGAVLGMQAVSSATCVQCHANPDDRHAPHRFTELRFEKAREETGAQLCVSCHREHSAVRVTAPDAGYCVSCHSDLKVQDDKTSPTHDFLVQNKRWESCLQCHDYHGNHRWRTPLRLVDAPTVDAIGRYLKDGPSPYGSTIVKAKEELSP